MLLTLMDIPAGQVSKGDLFLSRFGLAVAILLMAFLVGYMLIIIAKRVIGLMKVLQSPPRMSELNQDPKWSKRVEDPWAESSKRMSPVAFMDTGHNTGSEHQGQGEFFGGEDAGHSRGHDPEGPDSSDDQGDHDSGSSDSGPSDSGGGGDSGGSDSGSSDSGGGGGSSSSD